jgi:ketosteroid isomerase-like protein
MRKINVLDRITFAGLLMTASLVCGAAGPVVASEADASAITASLAALFDAFRNDDAAKFRSVVAPGFSSFDGGARFDGDALLKLIAAKHAEGWTYDWNLREPDIRQHGETAWAAYVNEGFVPAGRRTQVTWQESAFLRRHEGRWLIEFFHSSRANPAP